jgi:hypothetical protein
VPTAGTDTIEWQKGNTAKSDPFFILILNNPALERPEGSAHFVPDMPGVGAADRAALKKAAGYIFQNLFGLLPGQVDKVLGLSPHANEIRVVSMCIPTTTVSDATALVAEDALDDSLILVARRDQAHAFVSAESLDPDILFLVSQSPTHTRASAFGTTDDDTRSGIAFTYDGWNLSQRYFHLIPGMSAVHATVGGMTPVHEFGHAFSSYTNGYVTDLYVDGTPAFNRKVGRPIPAKFAAYDGTTYNSDAVRDGLGYPGGWQSYHPELIDPTRPAIMDNYWAAAGGPLKCQHDKLTRAYILDRVHAKATR